MTLRVLAVLTILAATAVAENKPATNKIAATSKKKPEFNKPTKVQAVTIPKDAVQVDANTYNYTDPAGKKWIYRKTPFGVSRVEDAGISAQEAAKIHNETAREIESTKAVEDGDSIRFERASPFGVTRWQRKKTDLNDTERAVWDRELQKRAASQNAADAPTATASKD